MAEPITNENFHLLEEFVCTAIPSIPNAKSFGNGRNGIAVNDEIRSEVARLATVISASPDPVEAINVFQQFLRDKLANIRKSAGPNTEAA
jgi:hypothetical protein